MDFMNAYLDESLAATTAFCAGPQYRATMAGMADAITARMRVGGKLLLCGNGGSAGDAQHIAGEFLSRLMYDRAPLPAVALTTDTSVLTAVGNDYGYERVFERQVLGLGRDGDMLLALSTSGTSPNVLRALAAARGQGMLCLGFTGANGGPMRDACDMLLEAPSGKTPVVQQIHITAAHIVCGLVERAMFPKD